MGAKTDAIKLAAAGRVAEATAGEASAENNAPRLSVCPGDLDVNLELEATQAGWLHTLSTLSLRRPAMGTISHTQAVLLHFNPEIKVASSKRALQGLSWIVTIRPA
ncbi:hypothetical protein NM688_g4203 [Phlebia brevispora]|uniref:Uncharacterized protein n=1 Tax=Phlebia brevispora TaxID=194682 RepID=A0ACC1T3K4_9APHY|nr:hypothetical protein NM688_g4203 [Phlebia brevispora]